MSCVQANTVSRANSKQSGLSLLELLVALLIVSVLVVAFLGIFSGTLRSTNEITSKSKLLSEGRNALQLIASKVRESCFVYQSGTISFGNGWTSQNSLGGNTNWNISTDPIVAMIVPPSRDVTNYFFYAYYPMRRDFYNQNASDTTRLESRLQDDQTWVLMEYRIGLNNISPSVTPSSVQNKTCNQWADTRRNFAGASGRLLIDSVQPNQNGYNVLSIEPSTTSVSVRMELRLQQNINGQFTKITDPTNLRLIAFPRNLNATQLP